MKSPAIPGLDAFLYELSPPSGTGVLLVGSRADVVSTPESNINLMVVPPLGSEYRFPTSLRARSLVRPMTVAINYILPANPEVSDRPEISVDLPREESLMRLAAVFATAERITDPCISELELPVLDLLEIRLLSRLASGQILYGSDVVASWRERLRTHLLVDYYVISTFRVAEHYRLRAGARRDSGDPLSALLLGQVAAEHYAYCAFALRGIILYETKNLGTHIRAAASTGRRRLPCVLTELELFLTDDDSGRLKWLERWRADLLDRLRATSGLATAFRHGITGATE